MLVVVWEQGHFIFIENGRCSLANLIPSLPAPAVYRCEESWGEEDWERGYSLASFPDFISVQVKPGNKARCSSHVQILPLWRLFSEASIWCVV